MTSPYTKKVSYFFEAGGEGWQVIAIGDDTTILFEEIRKNGQEDTHMGGEAQRVDGRWEIEQYTREQIDRYGNVGAAAAIEAFFNKHGAPGS